MGNVRLVGPEELSGTLVSHLKICALAASIQSRIPKTFTILRINERYLSFIIKSLRELVTFILFEANLQLILWTDIKFLDMAIPAARCVQAKWARRHFNH